MLYLLLQMHMFDKKYNFVMFAKLGLYANLAH